MEGLRTLTVLYCSSCCVILLKNAALITDRIILKIKIYTVIEGYAVKLQNRADLEHISGITSIYWKKKPKATQC